MSNLDHPIAPDLPVGAEAVLELVGHLGAALIQSDKIIDPIVRDHVQSAHRLALDLYAATDGAAHFLPIHEVNQFKGSE